MARTRRNAGVGFYIPGLGYVSPWEKEAVIKRLQAVTVDADALSKDAIALLREQLTGQVEMGRKARQFLGQ